jgi:uncharacterized protein (TIGR00730 family)
VLLTIYGSSSPRTPSRYLAAARELGRLAVAAGWRLRTGAGKDGCMGAVTDAALAAGGAVEGVILRLFQEQGLQHPGLAQVAVADDMRTRKRLLLDGANAAIALPGGPGTWEELWELAVQRQIGALRLPFVALDVDGHYAPFRTMLANAARDGLLYGPPDELLSFADDAPAALRQLRDARPHS